VALVQDRSEEERHEVRDSLVSADRYPQEVLDPNWQDDGVMPENVATLAGHVVGHRIVSAEQREVPSPYSWESRRMSFVLTLDNGKQVVMRNTDDCCAYTELESFFLDPASVDHVIMGVGTTEEYTVWHVYADYGDILRLQVGWSCGNPFYYGYGFDIHVMEVPA
jgi:hypothetical protein